MAIYRYRAITPDGKTISGKATADSEAALDRDMSQQGFELIDTRELSSSAPKITLLPQRVQTRDLAELAINMAQLIRAGVPMLQAINDIRDSTGSDKLRDVLNGVSRSVGEGEMLSQALANHPDTFDEMFVAVIRAGEQSGQLEMSFDHLSRHLRWSDEMSKRVRAAVRYPAFVLMTMLGMAAAMMVFLMPQLTEFLTAMQIELPAATVALIATSAFVQEHWLLVVAGPPALIALLLLARRRDERVAYALDALALRLPTVGMTLRKIALAHFAHFFTIMYKSGVGILECLDTARGVVGNRAFAERLSEARREVEQGSKLAAALRATGEFPGMVVRMVHVGEEAGSLDSAMENVSDFYDRDVRDAVQTLVDATKPALTLVVGALLIWIVLAVLGPIYDSFSDLPI